MVQNLEADKALARHMVEISAKCYRQGCLDACREGNPSYVDTFLERVRLPGNYGFFPDRIMKWREWCNALMRINGAAGVSTMANFFYNTIKSDTCQSSAFLRIFEELYLMGLTEFYYLCPNLKERDIDDVKGMFLISPERHALVKATGQKIFIRMIDACYNRLCYDRDLLECNPMVEGKTKMLSTKLYEATYAKLNTLRHAPTCWV